MFSREWCNSCSANFSGSGMSIASTSASTALSLACVLCWSFLTRSSCPRVSSRSSSRVSNSLASWAKSSSSSGSSRILTDCTVTVTSASWPAASPPARLRVLDQFAVHRRGQVHGHVVAVLGRTLHALKAREALAQGGEVLVNVVRGYLGAVDGDRQRVEVGQLELGPDLDLGRERQLLAVLELGDFHIRLAEDEHLGLLDGLAVELGQRVVDRLGQHRAPPDPHVDDARRHLARTAPGDARLLRDFAVSLVEARLKLLEGNLDAQ